MLHDNSHHMLRMWWDNDHEAGMVYLPHESYWPVTFRLSFILFYAAFLVWEFQEIQKFIEKFIKSNPKLLFYKDIKSQRWYFHDWIKMLWIYMNKSIGKKNASNFSIRLILFDSFLFYLSIWCFGISFLF